MTDTTSSLIDCPFCGSSPQTDHCLAPDNDWTVFCNNDECVIKKWYPSEEAARKAWNTRAHPINTSGPDEERNLAASNLDPMWGEPCRGFYCGCDGCKAHLAQTKASVMEGK